MLARVVLHIGTPKSGTTFLQHALWANREALEQAGVRLPGDLQRDMFWAAVEVGDAHGFWGLSADEIDGTWARLCRQARDHDGVTVMSHELLSGVEPEQARAALAALDGVELHVVVTVRDLARQITSEWQERVKNGGTRSYQQFQRRAARLLRQGRTSEGFWRHHDTVAILDRWTAALPPQQVHVVVAPPQGADARILWERFGEACGFDATGLDPDPPGARKRTRNAALGVVQVQLLRAVNQALGGRIPQPAYARVVKDQFAERVLAAQRSQRPQATRAFTKTLRRVAKERNRTIRRRGYLVHGRLVELVPPPVDGVPSHPDDVTAEQLAAAYAEVVAAMLVERAEERTRSWRRAVPDEDAPTLGRRLVRRLSRRRR